MTNTKAATNTAYALSALCAGAGVLHLAKPEVFNGLIPPKLPGSASSWTYGSGIAELAVAALLASPKTRNTGGYAAAALFVGVFPGNLWMAWKWRHRGWKDQAISLGRLPFQGVLVQQALKVAHGA